MFVDEATMQTLHLEGQTPDGGFIGLWKIVVVKNLPYTDMRRVGKIPKLLPHRLFPFARFELDIWKLLFHNASTSYYMFHILLPFS